MIKEERKRSTDTSNNIKRKKMKIDLMDACVRLITVHGRPMSLINDKAFRDIIDTVPQRSQTETINSHTVRDRIMMEANAVRNKIADEINRKLISVKVDAATCMGRSFLGINIQFVKFEKLQIRTLGVIELYHSHTAEYLKSIIMNTCSKFHI